MQSNVSSAKVSADDLAREAFRRFSDARARSRFPVHLHLHVLDDAGQLPHMDSEYEAWDRGGGFIVELLGTHEDDGTNESLRVNAAEAEAVLAGEILRAPRNTRLYLQGFSEQLQPTFDVVAPTLADVFTTADFLRASDFGVADPRQRDVLRHNSRQWASVWAPDATDRPLDSVDEARRIAIDAETTYATNYRLRGPNPSYGPCQRSLDWLNDLTADLRAYLMRFGLEPRMRQSSYERKLRKLLADTAPPSIARRAQHTNWPARAAEAMDMLRDHYKRMASEYERITELCLHPGNVAMETYARQMTPAETAFTPTLGHLVETKLVLAPVPEGIYKRPRFT
ncbi:Hypothetical protein UVM_LOCUS353 [uncultured virus]|nr:Hypothetical protein UVM_LOCUS353 [uncultured virus]